LYPCGRTTLFEREPSLRLDICDLRSEEFPYPGSEMENRAIDGIEEGILCQWHFLTGVGRG
ncbi:MAG: hypothetical protein CW694_07040, partial [Candidatus Syntrophoarchaeum sp. WYZ-LMO15]